MLRESSKAWSNGSEAYSSDPEDEEEEEEAEEDMVFGETDQDGVAEEMMDLSDLPTALFACSVHEAVFEEDVHRVRETARAHSLGHVAVCVCCVCVGRCAFESSCWMCQHIQELKPSEEQQVHDVTRSLLVLSRSGAALLIAHTDTTDIHVPMLFVCLPV